MVQQKLAFVGSVWVHVLEIANLLERRLSKCELVWRAGSQRCLQELAFSRNFTSAVLWTAFAQLEGLDTPP